MKNEKEFAVRLLELEVQEREATLDFDIKDRAHLEDQWKQDKIQIEQEIVRRSIESCCLVFKTTAPNKIPKGLINKLESLLEKLS